MNDDKFFLAALGGAYGVGNKSISLLLKFFGTARAVWFADLADLHKAGVRKSSLEAFIDFRNANTDAPEKIIDYCNRQKIDVCSFFDDDYPTVLKDIDSPPMFFYYRGQLQSHARRIAVVGSRQNTPYGQRVALELGEQLAASGLTVVSGAARGIDTFAHRGALKTGRTVAVLGCGINYIFPRENKKLFEEIAERGVVLSEFPPLRPPNRGTFPMRNRIVAGLSRGIVVVETALKSGSMITVDYALKYNRRIFAVIGTGIGCETLIRQGAIPIKCSTEVVSFCEEQHE